MNQSHFLMVAKKPQCFQGLNMPIRRPGNLFTTFPQIYERKWVHLFERFCQNCTATVWQQHQGSSTAHTFLYGMYTSLVSYIFIYLRFLGCGQCRAFDPGMVVSISASRMGRLVVILLNLFCWQLHFCFSWKCVTFKNQKYRTGDFTRPTGDFARPTGDFARSTGDFT